MAFLINDPSAEKPHIGATVIDSTESGEEEVLRSEVATAIWFLKHQFSRGDFRQHHTLPVSFALSVFLNPLPPPTPIN
jgi:hypothetical protein